MASTATWPSVWAAPMAWSVMGATEARRNAGATAPTSPLLTRPERALVAAVADAFFPPAGPIPLSGSDAGILRYFDSYLKRAQITQRVLMRLLLVFTELGPLLFGPSRRPFTRLSQDQRLRFLDEAGRSRLYLRRVSFIGLRALMTMAYLSNEQVAERMGMVANTDPFGLRVQQEDGDNGRANEEVMP